MAKKKGGQNKNRNNIPQKKSMGQAKVVSNETSKMKDLTIADESGFEDTNVSEESYRDNLNDAILDESTEINIVNNNLVNNNNVSKTTVEGYVKTSSTNQNCFSTNTPVHSDRSTNDINNSTASIKDTPPSMSRNSSFTSCGDSGQKDPFEVSYSSSLYNKSVSEDFSWRKSASASKMDQGDANQRTFIPKTIDDYVSLGVPRPIAEMKHPLENTWGFWYYINDHSIPWEENYKNFAEVGTIEDFWRIYNFIEPVSKIRSGCDYALFKKGIKPDWADRSNTYGGRWIIELQKSELIDIDTCWLETLFILIGEHADPYNHIINGAVVNVRPKKFRIAVWLKESHRDSLIKERAVKQIGQLVKERLELKGKIHFSVHSEDNGQRSSSKSVNKNQFLSL